MTTPVTIGGASVDMDDPCAMAGALKKVRLKVIAGDLEESARFGEDEVRFSKANIGALDREIDRYERACAALNPAAPPRRYAKTMRFKGGCR